MMPALPDFQDHPLPWVTEREYVFDAHRVVIADFDCDQDEARAHALARFIAAAPETAEKLEALVNVVAAAIDGYDSLKDVEIVGLVMGVDDLRTALARARGA